MVSVPVEEIAEAGMLDVPGDAPAPGPNDGSSALATGIGSDAGAALSVGPRGVLTVPSAPVWGRPEQLAIVVAGFSSMLPILPRYTRVTTESPAGPAHSLIERYESSILQKMRRYVTRVAKSPQHRDRGLVFLAQGQ